MYQTDVNIIKGEIQFGAHRYTQRNIFGFWSKTKFKPNLDCNYSFPIDLAPIGFPIGAKAIEKE